MYDHANENRSANLSAVVIVDLLDFLYKPMYCLLFCGFFGLGVLSNRLKLLSVKKTRIQNHTTGCV